MSFSSEVKEELYKHISGARHCQIAELAAIINGLGSIEKDGNVSSLIISTDKEPLYKKCISLINKIYNLKISPNEEGVDGNKYDIRISDNDSVWDIFQSMKFVDKNGVFKGFNTALDPLIIKNSCCRRAYLRGVFLCMGSMSDPNKGYHLEMVCKNEELALQIVDILESFDISSKIVCRKRFFVVYIKEGSAVVDFLGVCEAHVSLLELENLRVVKDIKNSVNRRANCEIANIIKTTNAANKQIEDILLLQRVYGFERLPDTLREAAQVRLEYPEATLQELGTYFDPPVGKSGVNHRLRKLSELAENLR